MAYFDGFVVPVPAENKDAYLALSARCAPIFHEFGATRHVEAWEDDVPDGTRTDFRRAVNAAPGEAIVFSWIEYPDRAARDAANAKVMADDRMGGPGDEMPFDGKRMIYAGFDLASGDPPAGATGYVDATLIAVPAARKDEYLAWEAEMAALFTTRGATRLVVGWGDDVTDGKVTDFKRAVQAQSDEAVAVGWIEWPDKAARDAAWGALMSDPAMRETVPPFDGKRMVHGGFVPILDI